MLLELLQYPGQQLFETTLLSQKKGGYRGSLFITSCFSRLKNNRGKVIA